MWILPAEPIVVRLMNTIWADRHDVHDDLTTPADLAAWLDATGIVDGHVVPTARDVARARRLRDACRALAAHVTADPRTRAGAGADVDRAIADVNSTAAMPAPAAGLVRRGDELTRQIAAPRRPVAAALTAIAQEAVDRFSDSTLPPLRACLAPGCVLYFVKEHPRREWCSTMCANRVRAARHYRRQRGSTR